jgi:beta-phosphoglucomutase-like phosphatase (HAD superfamily)
MIKAVIFDMDGLLINSEPFWQEAEIEVFQEMNIHLTQELCQETTGIRVDEVVDYWDRKFPGKQLNKQEVARKIVAKVIELICCKGESKTGVDSILCFLKTQNVKIALATSSAYSIINAVLEQIGIENVFQEISSAMDEEYGKPHPSVYLTTAKKLQVLPQECLVLEDSLSGVIAAKAARMKCIAIPENFPHHSPKFIIADQVLQSLSEITLEVWQKLNEG